MRPLFIAGTDTDIGKTVVTSRLASMIQSHGLLVTTQKWIQSGLDDHGQTDLERHDTHFQSHSFPERLPYQCSFPASPHLSAELENQVIDRKHLFSATHHLHKLGYWVLIEGSGGVMTPYNDKDLMIDLLSDYPLQTILVSANRLGTLNHTMLTAEALMNRGIHLTCVILNNGAPGCSDCSPLIRESNFKFLENWLSAPIFQLNADGSLPDQVFSTIFSACEESV